MASRPQPEDRNTLVWRFVIERQRTLQNRSAKIPYHSRKAFYHGCGAPSMIGGIRNSDSGGLDTIQGPKPGNAVRHAGSIPWRENRLQPPASRPV
jgi:hypothetical protein